MDTEWLLVGLAIGLPLFLVMVLLALLCQVKLRWSRGYGAPASAVSVGLFGGLVTWQEVARGGRKRSRTLLLGRPIGRRPKDEREEAARERKQKRKKKERKTKKPKRKWTAADTWFWIGHNDLVTAWTILLTSSLLELLRCVHMAPISLLIRMGLGDPAATGMAYGCLWSVIGPTYAVVRYRRLIVEPDWFGVTFASAGRIAVWLRPSNLVIVLLRLLVRAPWVRTLRAMRQWRKYRRASGAATSAARATGG